MRFRRISKFGKQVPTGAVLRWFPRLERSNFWLDILLSKIASVYAITITSESLYHKKVLFSVQKNLRCGSTVFLKIEKKHCFRYKKPDLRWLSAHACQCMTCQVHPLGTSDNFPMGCHSTIVSAIYAAVPARSGSRGY